MMDATAHNKRQKDAPHFYISWSLHCFRAWLRCYATFVSRESNDFLPHHVICHGSLALPSPRPRTNRNGSVVNLVIDVSTR